MKISRSKDGIFCYACNLNFSPDYMVRHLRFDHTHEEVAFHLALVYKDDWIEEWQTMAEAQIVE